MEGATFAPLAEALGAKRKVIAPDQRGHGFSDHATAYGREDYLRDLDALFDHLQVSEAALLGNSLGGVNAYQYAARHPERVSALIVEDIGVEIGDDMPPIQHWAGTFATREDLEARIGPRLAPYLEDSFRHTTEGWRLAFEPAEMMLSQTHLKGNYWSDWLATACPTLVIRGSDSRVTTAEHIREMAERRPCTESITLSGGHVVHRDNPAAFAEAVDSFLQAR